MDETTSADPTLEFLTSSLDVRLDFFERNAWEAVTWAPAVAAPKYENFFYQHLDAYLQRALQNFRVRRAAQIVLEAPEPDTTKYITKNIEGASRDQVRWMLADEKRRGVLVSEASYYGVELSNELTIHDYAYVASLLEDSRPLSRFISQYCTLMRCPVSTSQTGVPPISVRRRIRESSSLPSPEDHLAWREINFALAA